MPNPAEHIASKIMGTMKSAKAAVGGLSGVFRHLAEEHGEVTALLLRVKLGANPEVRSQLFPTIRKELLAHERAEIKAVYSVMVEHADTQQIAAQHNLEAEDLERMLGELAALDVRDTTWQAKFEKLVETVQQHVTDEEGNFFPRAQEVLGEAVADAMLPRYEAAKREVMERLN